MFRTFNADNFTLFESLLALLRELLLIAHATVLGRGGIVRPVSVSVPGFSRDDKVTS